MHFSIFGEKSGILISAGTGSVCVILTEDAKYKQIGGWGYLLGDEGSGYYIGREAIKMALFEYDGEKRPSPLSQAILSFYGVPQPGNLISIIYASERPQKMMASSAKTVCEMADKGDASAIKIIENAAKSLIELALEAIKIYNHNTTIKHGIALTGSILQEFTIVNRMFREQSKDFGLNLEYLAQELEPAAAGVLYSLKKCNQSVPAAVFAKLKQIKFS
jgi:N-acetylglucosamine kinase-like BadF-type ATPase